MNEQTVPSAQTLPRYPTRPPSRSPLRRLIPLLLFAAILLVFIAWLGDWRRRHNVQVLMSDQAQAYASLVGEGAALPLNLQPAMPLDPPSRIIDAWLSPDEALRLRGIKHEVMVAWTLPLVRALGRNERAVIFFEGGTFDVRWLTLPEFNDRLNRQITELRSPAADSR